MQDARDRVQALLLLDADRPNSAAAIKLDRLMRALCKARYVGAVHVCALQSWLAELNAGHDSCSSPSRRRSGQCLPLPLPRCAVPGCTGR